MNNQMVFHREHESTSLQSLVRKVDGAGIIVLHFDCSDSISVRGVGITLEPYEEPVEYDGDIYVGEGAEIVFDPDVTFTGRIIGRSLDK